MYGEAVERRTVLKRTVGFTAGIAALLGLGYVGTQPTAAIETDDEFLADDAHVERNDGEIQAVTIAPELELRWTDFGGGVDAVDVTMSAAIADVSGFDVLFDGSVGDEGVAVETEGFDAVSGRATLAFDRIDLTQTGTAVSTDDFGGHLAPGESQTTTVELTLRVDVIGSQEETVTTFETTEFDVTVHNPNGEATTTGRANTAVE